MKTFIEYLNEVNKTEKILAQKNADLLIGAELEFIIDNDKLDADIEDISNYKLEVRKLINKYFTDNYELSYDKSIELEKPDYPIEVITKPYTWEEFEKQIPKLLNFIKENGYTNYSTGFHATINIKNADLPKRFGDRLSVLMNDPKMYKDFPEREDNEYAQSRTKQLKTSYNKYYYDKYYTFRIRWGTNQVEFRGLGGTNYENKWSEIRNILLDYMANYKKALEGNKELDKKIILSKFRKQIDNKEIITNPKKAYEYARNNIRDRFIQAEPYIMKDPEYAFLYARNIIDGKWTEAEPYIMKSPTFAFLYAKYILQKKWPEAEKYIKQDSKTYEQYKKEFIK